MSQILEGLAFDQVGFQHRASQANYLMKRILQPVQVFIDLTSLC